MSKFAIRYFAVLGILALLGLSDSIVFLGYVLLQLPGAILNTAPSLFAYSVVVYAIWKLTWFAPIVVRGALAIIPVTIAAFLLPSRLNEDLLQRLARIEAQQMPLTSPVKLGETLAILDATQTGRIESGAIGCSDLCQKILYGGLAKTVITARLKSVRGGLVEADEATAFTIERRAECAPPRTKLMKQASLRAALGECLVAGVGDVENADTLFTWGIVGDDGETTLLNRGSTSLVTYLEAYRKLVMVRRNGRWEVAVLEDALRWYPVSTPLLPFHLSLVGYSNNFGSPFPRGWARERHERKSGLWRMPDGDTIFEAIFGVTLPRLDSEVAGGGEAKEDLPPHDVVARALRDALDNPETPPSVLASLIDGFSRSLKAGNAPQQSDVDLVARMIVERRIPDGITLPITDLGPLGAQLARPLAEALIRQQAARSSAQVRVLERAIFELPDRAASSVFDELAIVSRNWWPGGRPQYSLIRLADSGAKALPVFIEHLEGVPAPADDVTRSLRYAAYEGIICLGANAAQLKDVLLMRLREAISLGRQGRIEATLIMKALVVQGFQQEVAAVAQDDRVAFYDALKIFRTKHELGLQGLAVRPCQAAIASQSTD